MYVAVCEHVPGFSAGEGQERVLGLELELQVAVSCHVNAGNQTQVLWKTAKYLHQ